VAPTTGVPALSRSTPNQEARGTAGKVDPHKQRNTAHANTFARMRDLSNRLTNDATGFSRIDALHFVVSAFLFAWRILPLHRKLLLSFPNGLEEKSA
jgi:hypothetical protein